MRWLADYIPKVPIFGAFIYGGKLIVVRMG
jgi:hypothetical protein